MRPRAQPELPERDADCGERLLAGLRPAIEGALSLVVERESCRSRELLFDISKVSRYSLFSDTCRKTYAHAHTQLCDDFLSTQLYMLASERHVHKTQSLKVTINVCFQSVATF
jgi:hypothetical protein